jgi:hypothetical protein
MHGDYLNVSKTENAELGYGKITASTVNIRSGAGASYGKVDQAKRGEKVYIIGLNSGWYKVIYENSIGYIRSDYVELTEAPYENKASSKSPKFFRGGKSTGVTPSAGALNGTSSSASSSSSSTSSSSGTASGNKIVAKAKQYLGVPYKWGGTTPSGFDCSGFVYYVLRSLGYNASRTMTTMSIGSDDSVSSDLTSYYCFDCDTRHEFGSDASPFVCGIKYSSDKESIASATSL